MANVICDQCVKAGLWKMRMAIGSLPHLPDPTYVCDGHSRFWNREVGYQTLGMVERRFPTLVLHAMSACSSNRCRTAMPTSDVRTAATKSRKSYRFTYSIRTNISKLGPKLHREQIAKSLTCAVSTAPVGSNPTLTASFIFKSWWATVVLCGAGVINLPLEPDHENSLGGICRDCAKRIL